MRVLGLLPVLAAVIAAGCDNAVDPPTPLVLAGDLGDLTLDAAGSPYRLLAEGITITGTLTIEPGVVIEGEPDAMIRLDSGTISGIGTDNAPILLTAIDSSLPWGGIVSAGPHSARVELRHFRLEHARGGVAARSDDRTKMVTLRDGVLRRLRGPALSLGYNGSAHLENLLVEEAGLSGSAAVQQWPYSNIVIRETILRNSGGAGIYGALRGTLDLSGLRIEGAEGVGLRFGTFAQDPTRVSVTSPLRITGGSSYPVVGTPAQVLQVLAASTADSLRGNAADTLVIEGGGFFPAGARLTSDLPWLLTVGSEGFGVGGLVIEAGADVRLIAGGPLYTGGGPVEIRGTLESPVRLYVEEPGSEAYPELWFNAAAGDTSLIEHAELRNIRILGRGSPVRLRYVNAVGGYVDLEAPGSEVISSSFDGALARGAVIFRGPGLFADSVRIDGGLGHGILVADSGATILSCVITGSVGNAVHVERAGIGTVVQGCALVGNGGAGVFSAAPDTIDATGNWWGDPTGPFGPQGDSMVGLVKFEPWLSAPPGS